MLSSRRVSPPPLFHSLPVAALRRAAEECTATAPDEPVIATHRSRNSNHSQVITVPPPPRCIHKSSGTTAADVTPSEAEDVSVSWCVCVCKRTQTQLRHHNLDRKKKKL